MITFKFEGTYNDKPLSPENMKIEFLKDMLDILTGKLIPENCSVAIKKGSACLEITEEQKQSEQKNFFEIEKKNPSILTENKFIENLKNVDKKEKFDPQWNKNLSNFQKKLKKYQVTCNITTNDNTQLKINQDTTILIDEDLWHKTTKYVYGEIIDIGGNDPNIHLKDEILDKKIIIDIEKEEIRKIKENILYQKKSIYISCFEHELTREIKDNKAEFISWDDYDPDYVKKNFKKYRKEREDKFKKSWDFENIENNYGNDTDKWLDDIRYGKRE